jgi:hypothetical protein
MKINQSLNLVIPIYDEKDRAIAHVHSTPISAEVFDTYCLVIAKTYAQLITEGLGLVGGARIADKLLKKTAQDMGVWEGQTGVQNGLMNQIYRLTNVIHLGERGWQSTPYEIARQNVLTKDDVSEVEAAICYFILASLMMRKSQAKDLMGDAMKLWGAQIVSLNSTEYLSTLPVSTATVNTGVRVVA